MRNFFANLMAGRYGTDSFCRFLSFAAVFFLAVSMFTSGSPVGSAVLTLALLCLFWCWFRAFSKNIYKRSQENAVYLRIQNKVFGGLKGSINRLKQSKNYRFYKCPTCKTWLRVPKGKGLVNITCRQCGGKFTKKT
jgi:DNA-directed RNA polymerase subunit RPC12/RpoP